MNYTTLVLAIENNIATLTLNRPESANTINATMARELSHAAVVCDQSDEVRALVIRSEGKIFSAGGDLEAMAGADAPATVMRLAGDLHLAVARFARMNAPVIAAVNGTVAGGGFSLTLAADLVVSAESAKYVLAYTNAGLSPDGSATYFLPRRIGDRRARELMLTNRVLTATEALDWGLINRVVADDELEASVAELATTLARGPTRAFGQVKTLLNASFDNGLETQMELESRAIAEMCGTDDGQEGISAFLEKRRPTFTGR